MKKLWILILGLCLLLSSGCISSGKKADLERKNRDNLTQNNLNILSNSAAKLDIISGLAYGVGYSLNKIPDPSREVSVALDFNQRVISLSGNPSIEVMRDMQATIDKLTSTLEKEREQGKKMLDQKDKKIVENENQSKNLLEEKDKILKKYMDDAKTTAENADMFKQKLSEYEGWMGLKAIAKGLSTFVKSSVIVLIVFGLVFLLLRYASMTNPFFAAIFDVFNRVASWAIHGIALLFPKAIEFAGHISMTVFNSYKSTLTKVVDAVATVENNAKIKGTPAALEDVLDQVEKTMDSDEKEIVEQIKKILYWK